MRSATTTPPAPRGPFLDGRPRERRRPPRRRARGRLPLLIAALAALVTAAVLLLAGDDYPEPADDELHAFVEQVAERWRGHQADDGRYLDPVNGIAASGYGSAMIGYAQLTSPDEDAQRQGFRAMRFGLSEPEGSRGVFDQLVLARAYNWSRRNLAGHDDFEELRDEWRSNLERTADVFFFRPGTWAECFKSDDCYSNHEMVEAMADIELLETGLEGRGDRAKLRDRDALRARAHRLIGVLADRAAGRAAYSGRRRGLGVLADTGPYPLGYHVLSAALLAMAVDRLGGDAPELSRDVLRRSLDTLAAFMGPDGDLAYMGARYEQVWILAAAVYATRAGARALDPDAADGRRWRTAGRRALERLRRLHALEDSGLRVGTRPQAGTYRGVDGALIPANGLALFFLREASRLPIGDAGGELPADRAGHSFVDPAHARIGTVRTPELWFAVRSRPRFPVDPKRGPDQRYDFGLLRLKARAGGAWRDLIEPRPWTTGPGTHSSGPVLVGPAGEIGYPWGERLEARDGGIDVVGGFRVRDPVRVDRPGRWLRRGVTFRYRPRGRALELTWDALAGERFRVMTWSKQGRFTERPAGFGAGAASHVFGAPLTAVSVGGLAGSCCAVDVRPVQGELVAPGPGPMSWRIEPAD